MFKYINIIIFLFISLVCKAQQNVVINTNYIRTFIIDTAITIDLNQDYQIDDDEIIPKNSSSKCYIKLVYKNYNKNSNEIQIKFSVDGNEKVTIFNNVLFYKCANSDLERGYFIKDNAGELIFSIVYIKDVGWIPTIYNLYIIE